MNCGFWRIPSKRFQRGRTGPRVLRRSCARERGAKVCSGIACAYSTRDHNMGRAAYDGGSAPGFARSREKNARDTRLRGPSCGANDFARLPRSTTGGGACCEHAAIIGMPSRLKFIVAYDGAGCGGWQSQSHRNTIQDHLERAFERATKKSLRVHGAGRTDAGVHALAQCAHVDLAPPWRSRLTPAQWVAALNANLPPAIRVMRCAYVPQSFHARYSAKGKVYRAPNW